MHASQPAMKCVAIPFSRNFLFFLCFVLCTHVSNFWIQQLRNFLFLWALDLLWFTAQFRIIHKTHTHTYKHLKRFIGFFFNKLFEKNTTLSIPKKHTRYPILIKQIFLFSFFFNFFLIFHTFPSFYTNMNESLYCV